MAYGSVMFYSTNPWLEIRDTNELLDIFSPGLTFPVRPIFFFFFKSGGLCHLNGEIFCSGNFLSLFQFLDFVASFFANSVVVLRFPLSCWSPVRDP